MIVYKGKAKDFPVFMKNLRKQYAKKKRRDGYRILYQELSE